MFEPFPGNYVWNLATNLALVCGGNHGEIDEANRPIMEASKSGADAGSAQMFDSWIRVADQVAANAAADEAEGYLLSAGTKYLRASGYYLAAER
ncbi:MAG: alpha/beta hydrolase, partial [Novosphingobium sp.]